MAQAVGPLIHVGDLEEARSFWFWSGPALTTVAIGRVYSWVEDMHGWADLESGRYVVMSSRLQEPRSQIIM